MLRATIALAALAIVRAQPSSRWVEVAPLSNEVDDEVERRYTPELVHRLQAAKDDALLMYTEYSARSGWELKAFLSNMTLFADGAMKELDQRSGNQTCRENLVKRLKKIQFDSQRAASFSAENHHKFILGHMIVLRMHLNKSEDYVRKSEKMVKMCGIPCETTPKVTRWRRLALEEIHRVEDDMQHSRRSFKDLLVHARRKLNNISKQARVRARESIDGFHVCAANG